MLSRWGIKDEEIKSGVGKNKFIKFGCNYQMINIIFFNEYILRFPSLLVLHKYTKFLPFLSATFIWELPVPSSKFIGKLDDSAEHSFIEEIHLNLKITYLSWPKYRRQEKTHQESTNFFYSRSNKTKISHIDIKTKIETFTPIFLRALLPNFGRTSISRPNAKNTPVYSIVNSNWRISSSS